MISMRSRYKCVCGRTNGDKLYVLDSVITPNTDVTHKGSINKVTNHTSDATKNDQSRRAWHNGEDTKATTDDVSSDHKLTSSDADDNASTPKDSNANVSCTNGNVQAKIVTPLDNDVQTKPQSDRNGDVSHDDVSVEVISSSSCPNDESLQSNLGLSSPDSSQNGMPLENYHGPMRNIQEDRRDVKFDESMKSYINHLQNDKEELVEKLAASKECQMYLKQENQRLATHIEEMAGLDSLSDNQTDVSTTDTEKELEQFKRQYVFVNQELKILRQENLKLRQSQTSDLNGNRKSTQDPLKNNKGTESTDDRISCDINNEVDPTLHSVENDRIGTEINYVDINGNERNNQIAILERWTQTNNQDFDILNRYKTSITNVQTGFVDLKEQCVGLQKSYGILKYDTGMVTSTIREMMDESKKKILQALSTMNEQNDKLKQKYIRELKLRKQLQNQLVELKGNIRVFCRIRPCIKEDNPENDAGLGVRVIASPDMVDEGLVYVDNKGRLLEFDLDKVFGMECSQDEIFEEVSPLVRSVLDGYNVCIFAYGQTGSGKTYTMEGPSLDPGINQRALQLLFESLDQEGWTYSITASVLEIYNETIRDLLNPDISNKLEVKLKPEGGLHVPGVVVVPVTSLQEVNEVSETGHKHRCTATTSMNDLSSRSHCLLCVTVHGLHEDTGLTTTGRLNLVDLAGSERVGRSHADGVRLKEAQNINKSLACLGDVIHALRSKQVHVPYRNSKLTYLLQDSLGGDSKTLMIIQVSPAESNVCETVCSLNFGQRVRSVEIGPATRNVGKISSPTMKRPANLNLLQMTDSPRSPTSPSSAFTPHTTMLLSPSSPQTSPLSPSSPSPKLQRSTSSSSSSTTLSPQLSSQTPSSPSPKLRRSIRVFPTSTSSSLQTPSVSSSSPSSSPKPRRSAFTSSSSSSSTPASSSALSSQIPSPPPKYRKSTLSTFSVVSSSAPSSPSPRLRRSKSSSSSSTTTTTTTASSKSSTSSTPGSPLTYHRNPSRQNSLRSPPTTPTKSSLARSISVPQNPLKSPILNRTTYLRSKTVTSATSENSRQNSFASYPRMES